MRAHYCHIIRTPFSVGNGVHMIRKEKKTNEAVPIFLLFSVALVRHFNNDTG